MQVFSHSFVSITALIKGHWMVIPQRERVLGFIAMAGEILLPELLYQSMAFPVPWRDRSVRWGCMSFDGFACMHVCQDGWIIQPQRRKQPQTLINCNQSIYLMLDLFLLCRHTPSIWMWCQSVLEIVSTNLLLSFQIILCLCKQLHLFTKYRNFVFGLVEFIFEHYTKQIFIYLIILYLYNCTLCN